MYPNFWVDPEATVHLEHVPVMKNFLNSFLFILKWFQKCRAGHLLMLYLQTVLCFVSLRLCYTVPTPMEVQYWLIPNWCHRPEIITNFQAVISKCWELLILCRMRNTILLLWWWNYPEIFEDSWALERVVCLCGTSPVKVKCLKGLPVHLNCTECKGMFCSLRFNAFPGSFLFSLPFSVGSSILCLSWLCQMPH